MRQPRGAFARRVAAVVAQIPRGRVATYGQVAALCGSPRAARQVGWVLRNERGRARAGKRGRNRDRRVPWWRVLNREGRLSIVHPYLTPAHQAALLRKESVRVTMHSRGFWVDLRKRLWEPKRRAGVV